MEAKWLPIKSAPKDGTRVDLYGSLGPKRSARVPDCYWHKKAGGWRCKHYDRDGYSALRLPFAPTHWMPTPALPTLPPQAPVAPDSEAKSNG